MKNSRFFPIRTIVSSVSNPALAAVLGQPRLPARRRPCQAGGEALHRGIRTLRPERVLDGLDQVAPVVVVRQRLEDRGFVGDQLAHLLRVAGRQFQAEEYCPCMPAIPSWITRRSGLRVMVSGHRNAFQLVRNSTARDASTGRLNGRMTLQYRRQ